MPLKAASERCLGFDSITLVRKAYFITDRFDIEVAKWAGGSPITTYLLTYLLFIWVCATADRVHAYVDGGILPSHTRLQFNRLELMFYRVLGVKLFVWTYGADVRDRQTTLTLGEPNCCTDCELIGLACICDHKAARSNYRRVTAAATAVFSMGDMIEYTPGSRNDLFFWPIDFERDDGAYYRPVYPNNNRDKPLRVVHAANHRAFKGTRYLEAAVSRLRAEGYLVDLILVEKTPNRQAMEIYRTADVVFDQCVIGFHGYFAVEAMALGKPVMCYIRDPGRYLVGADGCPLLNVHRDELYQALKRLATVERDRLPELGHRSREYVKQYYSMQAFQARLARCYCELKVSIGADRVG